MSHPFKVEISQRDGRMVSFTLLVGDVRSGFLRMRDNEFSAFQSRLGVPSALREGPRYSVAFDLRVEHVEARRDTSGKDVARATLLVIQPQLSTVRAGLVALTLEDLDVFRTLLERDPSDVFAGERSA